MGGASSRWRESILSPAPTSEITTTASVSRSQTLSLSCGERVQGHGVRQEPEQRHAAEDGDERQRHVAPEQGHRQPHRQQQAQAEHEKPRLVGGEGDQLFHGRLRGARFRSGRPPPRDREPAMYRRERGRVGCVPVAGEKSRQWPISSASCRSAHAARTRQAEADPNWELRQHGRGFNAADQILKLIAASVLLNLRISASASHAWQLRIQQPILVESMERGS